MTIIRVSGNAPYFTLLSTDIVNNTFNGALSFLGAEVLALDTGKKYIIKSDGTLGEYALPVSLSATPSIDIGDVTLLAGENHIGMIGGISTQVDVTPTLTVHATYVANDYVGTSGTPMTFANAARVNAGTGVVVGAVLVDAALQSIAGELWLFDTAPTPPNDSAAWTITDAEAAKCIGIIPFGGTAAPYYASAANSVCPVGGLSILFKTGAASKDLFGCFVTRGAPTYASGDLTFRLRIWQD
jgi:hypothetical protein